GAGADALAPLRSALQDYAPYFAARADICRRLGDQKGARDAYDRALLLVGEGDEKAFLARRRGELG
ncbi:MAG: RNA polymerase sigma factor, partial [Pseudomonadota bacterium]